MTLYPITSIPAKWIVHARLRARSDALVLGEVALDYLVGRQALRPQRRYLSQGVLTRKAIYRLASQLSKKNK